MISESGNILYNGIPIPGHRYALATLKGGIVIMDERGRLERRITRKHGLGDNLVGGLCLDREQNLWLALNTGIAYVAISSPISIFDEANGLEGYLIAVRHFRDRLFVGSFDGVFVLDERRQGPKGERPLFANISPLVREGCDFLPLGDHLLVAAAPSLLLVDPELRTRTFGDDTFLALCRSPRFPDTIFTGLADGLGACRVQRGGDGKPTLAFYKDPFPAINDSIRLINCDANGNLWLTTAFNGLIHIRFRGRDIRDYELTRYGLGDGLPGLDWNYVAFIDGRLLVCTQKGIYEGIPASPLLPGAPRTRFRPERTFGKTYLDPPARMSGIIKDGQGRWWVRSSLGIDVYAPGGEISRSLRRESFAPITLSEGRSRFPLDRSVSVADRDYFLAAKSDATDVHIGDPVKGRLPGNVAFRVARRRSSTDGGFDGIIAVALTPDYIAKFFGAMGGEPGDSMCLMRRDGEVLVSTAGVSMEPAAQSQACTQLLRTGAAGSGNLVTKVEDKAHIGGTLQLRGYALTVGFAVELDSIRREWLRTGALRLRGNRLLARALWIVIRGVRIARTNDVPSTPGGDEVEQRRRIEAEMRQASKIEALGRMAGGIAHHFNNLLPAMSGLLKLTLSEVPPGGATAKRLERIIDSVSQGQRLVRNILLLAGVR